MVVLGKRQSGVVFLWAVVLLSACGLATCNPSVSLVTTLQQDCTAYQPLQCVFKAVTKPDGETDFNTYEEICNTEGNVTHECARVDLSSTSYSYTDPATGAVKQIEPSFCDYPDLGSSRSYRLQRNTGLPRGKLEDRYAKCLVDNLNLKLMVSNCRDLKLWTCDDCYASYKRWACSTVFKRCEEATDPNVVSLTCRDTCFDTVRKCPANIEFACPGSDPRDYSDAGDCYTL